MTTPTREARRPRWVLAFLAAVLAVAVGLFTAGSASALTPSAPQNAVGAFTSAAQTAVGPSAGITAGQRLGNDPPGHQTVVATGVAANTVRYGPMRAGPLPETVASTFRSGSYTATELAETTTLYRAYGGDAGALGRFWSRVRPSGPLQAQIDSALNPAWGNTASEVATIRVPAGTTIYEGAAASQPIPGGSLMGGGSQVYIPNVAPAWLVP